jgi:antirestriction protein ArdC
MPRNKNTVTSKAIAYRKVTSVIVKTITHNDRKWREPWHTEDTAAEGAVGHRIERADSFFRGINARIVHQGNSAFYSPSDDSITLPPFTSFFRPVDYYATLAHEVAHWAHAPGRCDRKLWLFAENAYAFEELVAELTAAYVCSYLGLELEWKIYFDHAPYLASWLKSLNCRRSSAILVASSYAREATEYLIRESMRTAGA